MEQGARLAELAKSYSDIAFNTLVDVAINGTSDSAQGCLYLLPVLSIDKTWALDASLGLGNGLAQALNSQANPEVLLGLMRDYSRCTNLVLWRR